MELQVIQSKIYEIRGQQVMLDFDLAELYEVETRALKQAVKRNMERFPPDFMFELTSSEINNLVSQNVIPSKSYLGGAVPFAFLEPGVAMLSSVLKSARAIEVNVSIIRAFIAVRRYMIQASPSSLSQELEEIKERIKALEEISEENDEKFDDIYVALTELAMKQKLTTTQRNPIGFIKPKE
jgi:translation initiation factor 2 alpha subunit (eIF-2alpha)